jgi:hypothetical protein
MYTEYIYINIGIVGRAIAYVIYCCRLCIASNGRVIDSNEVDQGASLDNLLLAESLSN